MLNSMWKRPKIHDLIKMDHYTHSKVKRNDMGQRSINNSAINSEDNPRGESNINKPSLFWLMTETTRASIEYGFNIPYNLFNRHAESGDGHPVLVLPGFMATDLSTRPLRRFLNKSGYTPYGWDLGRNYAQEKFLDELIIKVEKLFLDHKQKITLIGWSLGGIYARQVAKERPHLIRQVITMGSPFKAIHKPNHANWIHKLLTNGQGVDAVDPELMNNIPLPAPVPTTAIYSKQDGIVPWNACIEEEDEIHQNIEVSGSHLGLGVNNTVLDIIADRLKYSRENWVHYKQEDIQEKSFGICSA